MELTKQYILLISIGIILFYFFGKKFFKELSKNPDKKELRDEKECG